MTMSSTVNDENSAGAANNNNCTTTKPADLEHEAALGASTGQFLGPGGAPRGLPPSGPPAGGSPLHMGGSGLWPPPPPPPQWMPPEVSEAPTYTPLVKVRSLSQNNWQLNQNDQFPASISVVGFKV